jgi:hypothetical protein
VNKAKKAKVVRSKTDPYLLGRNRHELERLRRQVHELHGESRWLLDRISIRRGAKAIDLGCGPQGIVDLLSEWCTSIRTATIGERSSGISLTMSVTGSSLMGWSMKRNYRVSCMT